MEKIKKEMYESPKTECLMVGTQSIICASGAGYGGQVGNMTNRNVDSW